MKPDLTMEQVQALLEAVRDSAPPVERPPNTFRTEELAEALGCETQKARIAVNRMLASGKARPVEIRHRYPTGVVRKVKAWQLVT